MYTSTMMSGVYSRQQCKVVDSYTDQYGLAREREFVCVSACECVYVCITHARERVRVRVYIIILYKIYNIICLVASGSAIRETEEARSYRSPEIIKKIIII